MFFTLPDGQRFEAKRTKRGQQEYAATALMGYPCPDGSISKLWTLVSRHTTYKAASDATGKALKTPHCLEVMMIAAK